MAKVLQVLGYTVTWLRLRHVLVGLRLRTSEVQLNIALLLSKLELEQLSTSS